MLWVLPPSRATRVAARAPRAAGKGGVSRKRKARAADSGVCRSLRAQAIALYYDPEKQIGCELFGKGITAEHTKDIVKLRWTYFPTSLFQFSKGTGGHVAAGSGDSLYPCFRRAYITLGKGGCRTSRGGYLSRRTKAGNDLTATACQVRRPPGVLGRSTRLAAAPLFTAAGVGGWWLEVMLSAAFLAGHQHALEQPYELCLCH